MEALRTALVVIGLLVVPTVAGAPGMALAMWGNRRADTALGEIVEWAGALVAVLCWGAVLAVCVGWWA